MENTNCPVCGTPIELQTRFCPTCKFERRILPNGVSGEVQADENECIAKAKEFENERIAKAKEFYKTYEAAKSAADNAKAETDKVQSKLDKANKALEDKKKAHEETKSDLENEKTAHERTKSNLEDALKKEQEAHERTKSNLEDALKDEEAAHEETKSDLANEKEAHKQTKKALDDLKKNPQTPPHPIPTPNKKVIGRALFTQGGRSETVDLYEGGCRVTAPAWTNIRGELFEIICDKGMYFLRDLSGSMYTRHERKISSLVTVRNKDAFRIGELIIKLSFPKQ